MAQPTSDIVVAERGRVSTFAALRFPNFRLWFFGQTLSLMGTWMQSVAQSWLVYDITGSKFALGAVSFAGTLPTLFLMLPGGVVADRIPKRRLLLMTQAVMMLLAFVLAGLTARGTVLLWQIIVLAVLLGVANSFDAPARQALAVEMVDDRRYLMNVVALNSTIFNMARVVGPAIGGIVLAALGAAWCFGLNGLSFVAVIIALLLMHFPPVPTLQRAPMRRQIGEGLGYCWQNLPVRAVIGIVFFSSLFAFSYAVLLPAYAVDVLHTGEAGLGALNAAVGVGALIGSLIVASLGHVRRKVVILAVGAVCFPGGLVLLSAVHALPLALAALVLTGWGVVTQNATANTLVQSLVPDELRGRVMAVYTLMFFGTAPFGSLLAGILAQTLGVSMAIMINAVITLIAVTLIFATTRALRILEI